MADRGVGAGAHPASVVADLWRFQQSVSWLGATAADLLTAADARSAVPMVVSWASEGVETGGRSLPQAYRRVLELRWERGRPHDPAVDPIAQLQADVVRRNTVPVEEHEAEARAHVIAASLALQEEDPAVALALAMYNACQADRAGWPALLADVRARLSSGQAGS